MSKKTIIVIGAGKGNGNAIAREFASHDFRVVLMSRDKDHLDAYKKEFDAEGIETYVHTADAAKPETIVSAIEDTVKGLGTPDVLVYNVGITTPDGDRRIDSKLLLERYQIDCASGWDAAMTVATDEFAAKHGAILFTGGGFAKTFQPIPTLKPLCIDKAAQNAMNIVLHDAFAPRGIFVGSILVSGVVQPGDPKYDPALVARQFWNMYTARTEYQIAY